MSKLSILFMYFCFSLLLILYVYRPITALAHRESCVTFVFMHNWLLELSIKFDSSRTESLLQVISRDVANNFICRVITSYRRVAG